MPLHGASSVKVSFLPHVVLHLASLCFVLLASASAALTTLASSSDDLTRYVDPLIGSAGHGHVFVGANVPFGAVQLGPNNVYQGWDWSSGYHYSDDILIGFSHLHLSGTGCADLGDVLLMPYAGELELKSGEEYSPESGFASRYSHERETARAGYYAVDLLSTGVRVELTSTERAGFHRYTFPADKPAKLVVDLLTGIGDQATATGFEVQDSRKLTGRRFSSGWAKDQRVYFALLTSVPPENVEFLDKDNSPLKQSNHAARAVLSFPSSTKSVLAKVGISAVSEQNALLNVETEIPHWQFDKTAEQSREKWNEALQAIDASFAEPSMTRVFYTAIYHAMVAPCLFNDVNGDYRGADGQIHREASFSNYSVLSLWDTYRAEHPLLTLIQPERIDDFVNTMIAIAQQQGKLPVWHLMGNETDTMVGYSAAPVIADAILKGFDGFDPQQALSVMKTTAQQDERGLQQLKRLGFIPCDQELESVAKALEYAIDDSSISATASKLGDLETKSEFAQRATYYRNYFDGKTGFMRGKLADGTWRTPFDPATSSHRKDDYCEGNAWQYTWLVPHDPDGLVALLGGAEPFLEKWDQLFITPAALGDEASADISGLIGQYAHGNEPGHHIPYLAACAGKQWKTAARVREITTSLYDDSPTGLCGNEDCGQMSAWFLFSALGFYPVNPSSGEYVLGSPLVKEATITFPTGKQFQIKTENNSLDHPYIQSAKLNGIPLTRNYLSHAEIVAGGEFIVRMGPEPNKSFPDQTQKEAAATKVVPALGVMAPTGSRSVRLDTLALPTDSRQE